MNAFPGLVLHGLLDGILPEDHGSFEQLYEGVEILRLYGPDHGDERALAEEPSAALICYQPGASVPRHRHIGYEHIVVLTGSQSDEKGTYRKGACVINPPGTSHSVKSEEGCLVLAIWDHPVDVLTPESDE